MGLDGNEQWLAIISGGRRVGHRQSLHGSRRCGQYCAAACADRTCIGDKQADIGAGTDIVAHTNIDREGVGLSGLKRTGLLVNFGVADLRIQIGIVVALRDRYLARRIEGTIVTNAYPIWDLSRIATIRVPWIFKGRVGKRNDRCYCGVEPRIIDVDLTGATAFDCHRYRVASVGRRCRVDDRGSVHSAPGIEGRRQGAGSHADIRRNQQVSPAIGLHVVANANVDRKAVCPSGDKGPCLL